MVYKYKFNPIPILFCELYSEMSIFSDKIESRQKLSNDFYLSVGIDIYILLLFCTYVKIYKRLSPYFNFTFSYLIFFINKFDEDWTFDLRTS